MITKAQGVLILRLGVVVAKSRSLHKRAFLVRHPERVENKLQKAAVSKRKGAKYTSGPNFLGRFGVGFRVRCVGGSHYLQQVLGPRDNPTKNPTTNVTQIRQQIRPNFSQIYLQECRGCRVRFLLRIRGRIGGRIRGRFSSGPESIADLQTPRNLDHYFDQDFDQKLSRIIHTLWPVAGRATSASTHNSKLQI